MTSLAERSLAVIAIADLDGNLMFLNRAGIALSNLDADRIPARGMRRLTDLFDKQDQAFLREAILPDVARQGRWVGDFRLARRGDAPVAIELNIYHLFGAEARTPIALGVVCRDIAERKRSEQRLRTLVDAGAVLTHAFEFPGTFKKLAELAARTIATYCIIDLFHDTDGGTRRIERVATYHFERSKRRLLAHYADALPHVDHAWHPVARTLRDGSSSLIERVDDDWIGRITVDDDHEAAVRAMGLRSEMTVPLVAAGIVVGALTCGIAAEDVLRTSVPLWYDAQDVFFVEELGRRAGVAIENAQLFERQHRIAEALQAASLPLQLPAIDGLTLDAAYRPGSAEATIGGDWYDAFALLDGRVVFTVGDVMGNGLRAAVTMTKLRQAMQSAAMVHADPVMMLTVADRTLHLHDPYGYATALAAIFDPSTGVTTIASAGHSGPVLRDGNGSVRECPSSGLLLGLAADAQREPTEIATPPGSRLCFFTDGLTEATRSITEGMERLVDAVRDPTVIGDARPAAAIVAHVLAGVAAVDDIAVLTVAFG